MAKIYADHEDLPNFSPAHIYKMLREYKISHGLLSPTTVRKTEKKKQNKEAEARMVLFEDLRTPDGVLLSEKLREQLSPRPVPRFGMIVAGGRIIDIVDA